MDSFDCIFISTNDLVQPIWYQYKCSHYFHDLSIAAPAPEVLRAWKNLYGDSRFDDNKNNFILSASIIYILETERSSTSLFQSDVWIFILA